MSVSLILSLDITQNYDFSLFMVSHHSGEKSYKCPTCDKLFFSSSHLKAHGDTHITERSFGCPECGKKFKSEAAVSRHQKKHSRTEKQFICENCDLSSDVFKVGSKFNSFIILIVNFFLFS